MLPVLVRVPWIDIDVPTWGVLLLLALVVGVAVAAAMAAGDGVEPWRTARAGLVVVASALVGVHAMGVFDGSHGRVLYGGVIAGIVATLAASRSFRIGWRLAVDAGAVGLAFGIAIGRLGCFAGGCCAGAVCSMPWGVTYPAEVVSARGLAFLVPRHPVQLYEAALAAAIGLVLVRLHARRSFDGEVALAFLVFYPAVRFVTELFRGDDRGDLFGFTHATGMSPAQLISAGLAGLAILTWVSRQLAFPIDGPSVEAEPPAADR